TSTVRRRTRTAPVHPAERVDPLAEPRRRDGSDQPARAGRAGHGHERPRMCRGAGRRPSSTFGWFRGIRGVSAAPGWAEHSTHTERRTMNGTISRFMTRHFRHFNAATLVEAAEAWRTHLDGGGKMLVSMAGAMSTAEIGISLAEMIRQEKVHAISCTGANLEEDIFN